MAALPGDCFGELGLLTDHVRMATVRARSAVELLVLDGLTFKGLLAASPETAADFERLMAERT